jgi:hypothetical protein
MEHAETFLIFYINFLYLAGLGKIPFSNLLLDLFNKLTPKLKKATLLIYLIITSHQELAI